MTIKMIDDGVTPLYRQIMDAITQRVESGELPVGYQLPTVRELAAELGTSPGTVKHAYDRLAHMGIIEKIQGRGSFVVENRATLGGSTKAQALYAIDRLLNELEELGFGEREIRIFLDLKLRERAQPAKGRRENADEALSAIRRQLMYVEAALDLLFEEDEEA